MTTTALVSIDVELSDEKLDALVKSAESTDGGELATVATEIPRLVIEVNRLRQERNERVRDVAQLKRKLSDQASYIDTLRPRAEAEGKLLELEGRLGEIVSENEKVKRERDEKQRSVEALEARVKSLLDALVEMARGTAAEKYRQEAEDLRARAERAEAELAELKNQPAKE